MKEVFTILGALAFACLLAAAFIGFLSTELAKACVQAFKDGWHGKIRW